jgi:hypothetical protein
MRRDGQRQRQGGDAQPWRRRPKPVHASPSITGYAALVTPQGDLPQESIVLRRI